MAAIKNRASNCLYVSAYSKNNLWKVKSDTQYLQCVRYKIQCATSKVQRAKYNAKSLVPNEQSEMYQMQNTNAMLQNTNYDAMQNM